MHVYGPFGFKPDIVLNRDQFSKLLDEAKTSIYSYNTNIVEYEKCTINDLPCIEVFYNPRKKGWFKKRIIKDSTIICFGLYDQIGIVRRGNKLLFEWEVPYGDTRTGCTIFIDNHSCLNNEYVRTLLRI